MSEEFNPHTIIEDSGLADSPKRKVINIAVVEHDGKIRFDPVYEDEEEYDFNELLWSIGTMTECEDAVSDIIESSTTSIGESYDDRDAAIALKKYDVLSTITQYRHSVTYEKIVNTLGRSFEEIYSGPVNKNCQEDDLIHIPPEQTIENTLEAYGISGLHAPLHEAGQQSLSLKGDMFILDMDDPWDLRYVRTVQTCRRRYVDMVNVVTYAERIRLFAIIQ